MKKYCYKVAFEIDKVYLASYFSYKCAYQMTKYRCFWAKFKKNTKLILDCYVLYGKHPHKYKQTSNAAMQHSMQQWHCCNGSMTL